MKVLIDARSVNPRLQGVGRHVLTLLMGLSHVESDLEFVVWYRNPLPLKVIERSGGPFRGRFQWIKASTSGGSRIPLVESMELAWICKVNGIGLFHDVAGTGLKFGNLPVIMTIHALEQIHFDTDATSVQRLKREMTASRILIAVSQTVAAEIESHFHISMPKIRVIVNAVDPWYSERVSKEEIRATRERFHLPQPYFLCVTAERPSKNAKLALETARVSESRMKEPWVFTLPSPPDSKPEDHFRFLDLVEDVWLRPLYADCKAAVIPSLYEGFSLPPLEALALGAVPVVSDIAAHREVLGEFLPDELFFDPNSADALEKSLGAVKTGGEPLKAAILDKFRMVNDRYSFKQTAARVHAVYREVLS